MTISIKGRAYRISSINKDNFHQNKVLLDCLSREQIKIGDEIIIERFNLQTKRAYRYWGTIIIDGKKLGFPLTKRECSKLIGAEIL